MLPPLLLLGALLALAAGVTRETVQRMVVVRTSGSDLAPAATGYLYHKSDDGESVVRMADGEIERRLADAYPAPHATARVLPVTEQSDEREPVDGAADFDYSKLFADFGAADGGRDYDDYFKRIKDEFHRKYAHRGAADDASVRPHYEKGEGDSYSKAKFESYSFSDGDDTARKQPHRAPASYEVYDNSEADFAQQHFPRARQYYGESARSYAPENAKATSTAAESEASAERPAAEPSSEAVASSAETAPASDDAQGSAETPVDSADAPAEAAERGGRRSYGYEIKH